MTLPGANDATQSSFAPSNPAAALKTALNASPINREAVTAALAALARMRRGDVRPGSMHPIAHALMSIGDTRRAILRAQFSEEVALTAAPLLHFCEKAQAGELQWVIPCLPARSEALSDALLAFASSVASYELADQCLEEWQDLADWHKEDTGQLRVYLEAAFPPGQISASG